MKTQHYIFLLFVVLTLSASRCKKDDCQGDPVPGCNCPAVYDPVCGCDGNTYGNSCEAGCAGIQEFTEGACGETSAE